MDYGLQFKSRIPPSAAKKMIFLFARHGNHYKDVRFQSNADVKRFFAANGIDFQSLVDRCRNYRETVLFFENLVTSTATIGGTITGRVVVSRVDPETGEEDSKEALELPAKSTLYGYWATFEASVEARDRAVAQASFAEFHSALAQGIASIEGYINYGAELWNKRHPRDQLLDPNKNGFVRFDTKTDVWIPKMTGGRKLDKGTRNEWAHFKTLRDIRDNLNIHPKKSSYSISLYDLANQINMFRTGVAGLLIQLHVLFDEKIPRVVIRARYAPDVEVVEQEG